MALVKPAGHTGYHYKGLKICGSVWACPLCASKVQERRRQEVAQAIGWATELGKGCAMVSYTFRTVLISRWLIYSANSNKQSPTCAVAGNTSRS